MMMTPTLVTPLVKYAALKAHICLRNAVKLATYFTPKDRQQQTICRRDETWSMALYKGEISKQ